MEVIVAMIATVDSTYAINSSVPGFDFSQAMKSLCEDICTRLDEFIHIKMGQVAITFAQARRRVNYGLQAKITPLRFEGGKLVTRHKGKKWTIQRWYSNDIEIMYFLTFYLPRFQDQSFREKLITIIHELYHISPDFNGDIRRLPGHCHVHSHSEAEFDRQMEVFVDQYLDQNPPIDLYRFLTHNFFELTRQFGQVVGIKVPIPKLVPL